MTQNKLFIDNSTISNNLSHICPNTRFYMNDILKDINNRLFFDNNLSYDQRLFILNNRNTIEQDFLDLIFNKIQTLINDNETRQHYLANFTTFSRDFQQVNRDTNIQIQNHAYVNNIDRFNNDDDDDDNYFEEQEDNDDNDDCSYYDDLENQLLDEYEFENDRNNFRITITSINPTDNNNNSHNNNDDHNEDKNDSGND